MADSHTSSASRSTWLPIISEEVSPFCFCVVLLLVGDGEGEGFGAGLLHTVEERRKCYYMQRDMEPGLLSITE